MLAYCNDTHALALHREEQGVAPGVYEGVVAVIALPDGFAAELDESGRYVRPVVTPEILGLTRVLAARRVARLADVVGRTITGAVPEDEKASWALKGLEADAWLADSNAATPIIDAELAITSEVKATLIADIAARAALYRTAAGSIAAVRRMAKVAIEAAGDVEAVEAAVTAAAAQLAGLAS